MLETGLGGRLDSTNVISPSLTIITSIGKDHMHILGDTEEEIAHEKGGIIKRGAPTLIGPNTPLSVFKVLCSLKLDHFVLYFLLNRIFVMKDIVHCLQSRMMEVKMIT